MSTVFESINGNLARWIGKQKMFFVSTAPLDGDGFVNCSPKGGESFCVLGPNEVAYQDYTGSGVETIAHLRENGRIVVMFCAFEGPPKIVRLHGQGAVVTESDPRYRDVAEKFSAHIGTRAFIVINVSRIADSCGYAVPTYDYKGQRDGLDKWAIGKGVDGVRAYQQANNLKSLDGLPGVEVEE